MSQSVSLDSTFSPSDTDTVTRDHRVTASGLIKDNLTDYGESIVRDQFPSMFDGLKKLHQRFIFVLSGDPIEEPKLGIKVVSQLNELHPFNPDSMYEALIRLGQRWNTNPPLVEIDGQRGSYSGDRYGSMRYVSLGSTSFTRTIFFRGLDVRVLPMERGPFQDMEPQYFIPVIPTSLLYDNLSIGFGYQSKTASLSLSNICDLVSAYAEHMDTTPWKGFSYQEHAQKFLPEFPTPCLLTNADELLDCYTRGEFDARILMDGRVSMSLDTVVIESLPHGVSFEPLRRVIEQAIAVKNGVFDKKILSVIPKDPSVYIGGLTIKLKRGVDPFDLLNDLDAIIKLSGSYVPNPNYVMPTGRIINLNYVNLLAVWYKARHTVIMATKRRQLQDYKQNQWRVEARLVAVAHTDRVVQIIRSSDSKAEAIKSLSDAFGLTHFQSSELVKLQLDILTRLSGQDLEDQHKRIVESIDVLNRSFSSIGQEISDAAQKIKKEFHVERSMHIPAYCGYVELIDMGLIQVESWAEIEDITENFPRTPLKVHAYEGPHRVHLDLNNKPVKGPLSKHMRGSIRSFVHPPRQPGYYSINIRDGAGCYVDGVVYDAPPGVVTTGQQAMGVTRKGQVMSFDVPSTLSRRQTISSRGANTELFYVYPEQTARYYLVVLNPLEKNIVHLQRVELGDQRIVLSPVGKVIITHHATGKDWFLSIPEDCLNRVSVRTLQITDTEALLGEARQIKLDLASARVKKSNYVIAYP